MALIYNQREYKAIRRTLREKQTPSEELLWYVLRGNSLGVKFRRQYGIGPYIVDFCAPRKKLVIEIDGSIHSLRDVAEYDVEREADIQAFGFTIVRFTADEITGKIETVLQTIQDLLASPSPYEGEGSGVR